MQKEKSKFSKFIITIAVTTLVPLSFFIIAKVLKKDHIQLPKFYVVEKTITKTEGNQTKIDTVFHQLNDLELTNQLGQKISINKDLKDRILVFDFFFTNCPSICPKLTNNMKLLQRAFRKDPKREEAMENKIQLISITVNPERDSVAQLRKYADRFGVNHDHWSFLTGDKKVIYDFARNELGLSVGEGDGGADDFIHTEKIVIVDRERFVRGYYDGLDSLELAKCAYDISLLTMEKKRNKK